MRLCEVIWDVEKSDRIQAMVESASGQACPCVRGLECPLIPTGISLLSAPEAG